VPLLLLFFLVCGVLAVESRQQLWLRHVGSDVGVFWIQANKLLAGQLAGTEYPPMAVLYFLLPRLADEHLGIPFSDGFAFLNYLWIGLHLAFLNQTAGRLSAVLFGAMLLAAGPIVMFRFELFVSFLVLMGWHAWRRGRPGVAGAVVGVAVLTKLYPVLLIPVLCRPPDASNPKRHVASLGVGVASALMLVMAVFVAGGGSLSMFEGTLSFHGNKPVALESTAAAVAMAFDYLRGAWPSQPVNAWGIHGLVLGRIPLLLCNAGALASLGILLFSLWRRRHARDAGQVIRTGLAILTSLIFWTPVFQPQYLLWPATFAALLPAAGLPTRRCLLIGGLLVAALLAEQVIFPCHYSEFLAIFYEGAAGGMLMPTLAVGKLVVTALFALTFWEALREAPQASTRQVSPE
jgi:hypothetical protein